jgi:hypothetical protein
MSISLASNLPFSRIPKLQVVPVSINALLRKNRIHPVLMEVGAREKAPEIWDAVAQSAIYVAAGPDSPFVSSPEVQRFYRGHYADVVVREHERSGPQPFHVTRDPRYSTVLTPRARSDRAESLDDRALLDRRVDVSSTTLNALVSRFDLPTIDWLNTNVNGLDLRLYRSLDGTRRRRLLALDTVIDLMDFWLEPGSHPAAVHEFAADGLWVSRMSAHGFPRMRRESISRLHAIDARLDEQFFDQHLKRSPGWVFLRLLRTIESLSAGGFSERDSVVLWAFALLDEQFGYAADVAFEYGRVFGESPTFQAMVDETAGRMRRLAPGSNGVRQASHCFSQSGVRTARRSTRPTRAPAR